MRHLSLGIEAGAATHVGKVRQSNEDNYLVATRSGLWAVADGMGGHDAGDVASRVVVDELGAIPTPETAAELLANCEARIVHANSCLKRMAHERGGAVIGTTVAILLAFDAFYTAVWSGDSRIYRIREGQIEQVSRDHTEIQELISEGALDAEEARSWPYRNVVTRAIGAHDQVELEMNDGVLKADDMFIICSDGLTTHVADDEILAFATRHGPQRICDLLVALTLDRGASDNVTVVAVRFNTAPASATSSALPPDGLWD